MRILLCCGFILIDEFACLLFRVFCALLFVLSFPASGFEFRPCFFHLSNPGLQGTPHIIDCGSEVTELVASGHTEFLIEIAVSDLLCAEPYFFESGNGFCSVDRPEVEPAL